MALVASGEVAEVYLDCCSTLFVPRHEKTILNRDSVKKIHGREVIVYLQNFETRCILS